MRIWRPAGDLLRKTVRGAALAGLAAMLASCAAGGDPAPANAPAASGSKNPEQALTAVPSMEPQLRALAEGGNALAATKLGLLYQTGESVTKNLDEAVKWYRLGAAGDNAVAENALGFLYMNGVGLPQDYAEALSWFRKAAAQNYAVAQNNLGTMYESGHGVPVDHDEAARLFQLSANQGYWLGAVDLGAVYLRGVGVQQSNSLAYFWLAIGSAGAVGPTAPAAAKARDAVAAQLSADEVSRIQALAHDWKPNGDTAALLANAGFAVPAHGAAGKAGGMGVIVSRAGHILTNAHLLQGCRQISVQLPDQSSVTAGIVVQDMRNDLALLKLPAASGDSAPFRAARSIGQGSSVNTFNGSVARGALAAGSVAAVSGANNDTRFLEIASAATAGSGGPVIDGDGNLVAITTDEVEGKTAAGLGLAGQNRQLAIKGSVLRDFLEANGIAYLFGAAAPALSPAELSERARKETVLVSCAG